MPNDDDGQDHMFRFILLKEVDCRSATFGVFASCNTKSVARYGHQVGDRLRSVHALFAQLASPAPKCHRDLQSWSVLTSNWTWYLERTYCIAGNFRQRQISSKATVRHFVRNLFSSKAGRRSFALCSFGHRSFAYLLSSHSWILKNPTLVVCDISQEFNFVKKLL